ncbi:DUF222 domain-containing protein [Herbiconiux sp. UC225_62]|uniref:HNH endonuclease signature motif containing protein n=1 Tax=Herbiconiux sp. UC225_62 TaxID=3350168 RepID=UPI0036D36F1F
MKVQFGDHVETVDALDAHLDMVIDRVSEIRLAVARLDADMAVCLAEAAKIADARAAERRPATASLSDARARERQLVATEIATATIQSERTVARMINDAESLVHDFPATLAALRDGTVTAMHTRHLVAHASAVPTEARAEFETRLLEVAATETAYRFDDKARRMRELAHPESITVRAQAARDDRSVFFAPECDGMATLTHYLPATEAVAIDDLLDKVARSERSADDPRTHAQRRADALTTLVLSPDNPARPASISAAVMVTVPAATIAGGDEPGELHGYGSIDPDTAREIAATAPTFLRVLTHPVSGEPTVITRHWGRAVADNLRGHDRYSASPELRLALAAIDETCRFPHCSRRANRCELDHTRDWANDGGTTPENLAYLCSRHHHLKHETGWTVESDPDRPRHLKWTSPHGRSYSTAPARAPAE